MSAARKEVPKGLALIAAPWPLYNRPSLQLGVLKSYLRQQFPTVRIQAHHLYLPLAASIGYDTYQAISERTWLAESVYAAVLFPEHFGRIDNLFRRQAAKQPCLRRSDLGELCTRVQQRTDELVNDIDWGANAVAGFSVSLCQFSATLYMLQRIKQINPAVACVVGGSTFSGVPPEPVFEMVAGIDLIVSGEGELPLAHLVRFHLLEGMPLSALPPLNGIHSRHALSQPPRQGFTQLTSLDRLPPPDFDDYFDRLTRLPPERRFFASLPLEISRGCWWQRSQRAGESGCAFCNLNLQWSGYRQKSAGRALKEIDRLTSRYQTLSIAFADNVLPVKQSAAFFESLGTLKKDLRLFGEVRPTTAPGVLERMRAAGMQEVQIGIEALSTRLLQRLAKGSSAIDNLAIMKNCEELGIKNVSNLILMFPGSSIQEVEETLYTLEFAQPFRPLKPVEFWLGMGSPLWQRPQQAGIRAVRNHRNWAYLFPEPIASKFPFIFLSYRADRRLQRRLWQPVRAALKKWEYSWRQLHTGTEFTPALSYRDGREFLLIRQRRPASAALTHRLSKISGRIYVYCRKPRSIDQICATFHNLTENKISAFLEMMVAKRLMFAEDNRYLSLAVRERLP